MCGIVGITDRWEVAHRLVESILFLAEQFGNIGWSIGSRAPDELAYELMLAMNGYLGATVIGCKRSVVLYEPSRIVAF